MGVTVMASDVTAENGGNAQGIDAEGLAFAKKEIERYGDKMNPAMFESIYQQKIVVGMSPYEAKLAGGSYFFRVDADTDKWPSNADPYVVIARQELHPDNSKLWFTFRNKTQFDSGEPVAFTVYFEHGRVKSIQKK
jgi:hypothetical protein